jgi:ABC-type protease/lipase transport system fused ATPase/permease subunit
MRKMILPAYEPPSDRRASLAVGLAPVFVLVVFSLIVSGLIAFDTGVAIFLACTVWVVYEMHDYQRALDDYNQQYVHSHLAWRTADMLEAMAGATDTEPQTSGFVRRFIGGTEPSLLPDQPQT